MKERAWQKILYEDNVPERLKGKTLIARMVEKLKRELRFEVDMPDNPTAQEMGYFKWLVGEIADEIWKELGFGLCPEMQGPTLLK